MWGASTASPVHIQATFHDNITHLLLLSPAAIASGSISPGPYEAIKE
jgi:hypothetical protein